MDPYEQARLCLEHLDLRPGATLEDVKQAYRTLVQVWHPDRFAKGTAIQFKAEERFKDVTAAYAWLSDNPRYIEDLATGRWQQGSASGTDASGADSATPDEPPPNARKRWFHRRYHAPVYVARGWIPQIRVPWVLLGAAAAGGYILLRDRDPYDGGLLRPQVFQNVADAIQDPRPENLWVYDQRIDIRKLPGANSPRVGFLRRGEQILAHEAVDGWRKLVDFASGAPLGWVQDEQVGTRPPSAVRAGGQARADSASLAPMADPESPNSSQSGDGPTIGTSEAVAISGAQGVSDARTDSSQRGAGEPLKSWDNSVSFYTEPFDVPRGSWEFVFKTLDTGRVHVRLYAFETNQLKAEFWHDSVGVTHLDFEGDGSYRVHVVSPGVRWEATVEGPR